MMRARAQNKARINRAFAQEWRSAYAPSGNHDAAGFIRPFLANQWLLVGSPYDFGCDSFGPCIGDASLIDLTKITP
jgi:hypothetical protein